MAESRGRFMAGAKTPQTASPRESQAELRRLRLLKSQSLGAFEVGESPSDVNPKRNLRSIDLEWDPEDWPDAQPNISRPASFATLMDDDDEKPMVHGAADASDGKAGRPAASSKYDNVYHQILVCNIFEPLCCSDAVHPGLDFMIQCPASLQRMRRYFTKSKHGQPVASKEALQLWKTDEGRTWDTITT